MKTIIDCMCGIVQKMHNPGKPVGIIVNPANTKKAAADLRTLRKVLGMSTMQVLILTSIVQNSGRYRIEADDIAHFLGMEYIEFLTHHGDLEDLKRRGYIRIDGECRINMPKEVLKTLQGNKAIEPEPTTGLTTGKILTRIKRILEIRSRDELTTGEAFDEIRNLLKDNPETSIGRTCNKHLGPVSCNECLLFFALIYRYWFERDDMVTWHDLDDYFEEFELDDLQISYRMENLRLQIDKLIEYAGEGGMMARDFFRIKDEIKEELLQDVGGIRKKEVKISASRKLAAASIGRKEMIYNPTEECQISQLKQLLSGESFDDIRARMKAKGYRSGFTCLFYGTPGTGKTETVYQIAKESGRDLFVVDVSQIKSCWVGESEKNIKEVFDKYRACVRAGGTIPILLFNEADAIFGIRQQGAEKAVDKMENSIQNIILQEMEDLDGILIATTNLTENLDKAFERRFLYKVRFERPSEDAKRLIWKAMLPDISDENAEYLAGHFDLSGGQIENVARKKTVQSILSGSEPSLEDLIKYCSEEEIAPSASRSRIGY